MLRIIILVSVFCLLALASTFAVEADGGYAGAFLQMPAGARPTAMGGAYLAVSNDGAAPLFNPAGLATLPRPLFGTSYRVMKLDRTLGYATFVCPVQGEAALGAHWLYAGSGSVEARDSDGDLLGRELSQHNHQFTIIFAKRFERFLAVGANINYVHSTLSELSAYSVGFDLGAMLYVDQFLDREKRDLLPVKDIKVGLTIKHIAKLYKWGSEKYDIKYVAAPRDPSREQRDRVPIEVGLGASARFLQQKLLVATDILKNEKQAPFFHAGAEYYLVPEMAIRSGYSDGRFTAGTGYLFKINKHQLVIDYAFSTDKADEGSEHIFSFDLWF